MRAANVNYIFTFTAIFTFIVPSNNALLLYETHIQCLKRRNHLAAMTKVRKNYFQISINSFFNVII